MSEIKEILKHVQASKDLASDAVSHLVEELSQYDSLYQKYSQKEVGRFALINAREAGAYAAMTDDVIGRFDEQPMLFQDIERSEKLEACTDFARQVGRVYIGWLFNGTIRRNRPFSKEIFPYPDGQPRVASVYVDSVWAPQYAEELVTAHELGINNKTIMEEVAR